MCVRYYSFLLLYSVLYSFSLRGSLEPGPGSLLNPVGCTSEPLPVHF